MTRRYVNPDLLQAQQSMQPVHQLHPHPAEYSNSSSNCSSLEKTGVVFPWGNVKFTSPSYNSLPSYFKSTTTSFPADKGTADNSGVPLGLIINPCLACEVPVIDYSASSIQRCSRCRSYLSPFSQVLNGGRVWKCPFCNAVTDFQGSAANHGDNKLAELICPVYDIRAPPQFRTLENDGPCFVVLIDLSVEAIATGFTQQFISTLKVSLDSMDQGAYFSVMKMSSKLSLFDFSRETEFVVNDLNDLDIPPLAMAKLGDCKEQVVEVLDQILVDIQDGKYVHHGNCLGSALELACKAMKDTGGVFIASCVGFPTVGPRILKQRDLIADTETQLLRIPNGVDIFYRQIGFQLNRSNVSLHLFVMKAPNQPFVNLSMIGIPCGLTCGSVHHYREFDPQKLHNDLFATLTTDYLWHCSMKLRCSPNIKISYLYTNCTIKDDTSYYPAMEPNTSATFELQVTGDLNSQTALFQCAFLWTNKERVRFIRIFTFSLPTVNSVTSIRQSIDEGALAALYLKRAAIQTLQTGPSDAANTLKKSLSSLSSRGYSSQSLYHLFHSMLCCKMLRPAQSFNQSKQKILSRGEIVDERYNNILPIRSLSLTNTILYLYPKMIATDASSTPTLPLDSTSFSIGSCFLVHTIDKIYIWISPNINPEYLQNTFGVSDVSQIPEQVPQTGTPSNAQLLELINQCYTFSGKYLPIEIIPPGSPRESIFSEILVDMIPVNGGNLAAFISEMTSLVH